MATNIENLFSKGFPTNRIPVTIPSTGQYVVFREATIVEVKSMCKTIIDNFDRKQMDVIYDAEVEYLQSMVLTDGIDVWKWTEFDRLYCLMVFYQMAVFKDPVTYKCQNCGADLVYRYDMSRYLGKMESAFAADQEIEIDHAGKTYKMVFGWPSVKTMSGLMKHFYRDIGEVTEEMERTQFGINFVFSFIKRIFVINQLNGKTLAEVDLDAIDEFSGRVDCLNEIPSLVMFDEENGVFEKVMGFFINRLENCFSLEPCPQCKAQTEYGLPHSSVFNALFCASMKGIYGFILKVECLLLFRYDCCIFDKEPYMTYNDLYSLIHQLGVTVEKDNKDRQKVNGDGLYKGLWYIREILNTLIFPQDKMKH